MAKVLGPRNTYRLTLKELTRLESNIQNITNDKIEIDFALNGKIPTPMRNKILKKSSSPMTMREFIFEAFNTLAPNLMNANTLDFDKKFHFEKIQISFIPIIKEAHKKQLTKRRKDSPQTYTDDNARSAFTDAINSKYFRGRKKIKRLSAFSTAPNNITPEFDELREKTEEYSHHLASYFSEEVDEKLKKEIHELLDGIIKIYTDNEHIIKNAPHKREILHYITRDLKRRINEKQKALELTENTLHALDKMFEANKKRQ